jgi:formylglycine-generating enzyme required for sulfatase activity
MQTVRRPLPDVPREFTNSIGMKFVLVPQGTFWMGGGGGKPGDKQVEIKQDFYLGKYEVTQGQWEAVMGPDKDHPIWYSRKGGGAKDVKDIPDAELKQFPVENVSWDEAQAFIKKLNEREKGHGGWVYRLPTEAEWEYSCRGGATSQEDCSYHFYFDRPTNDLSSEQANFDGRYPAGNARQGEYLQRTTKVGSYKPNRLGVYDMHGNVWEWCEDSYDGGPDRVIRGGGWDYDGVYCRAADRSGGAPGDRYYDLGFRLARVPSGARPGRRTLAEPGAEAGES